MAVDRAVDREIARLARMQNGNVTREQLRTTGLTPAGIKARVARVFLRPMYRGVYAVGDPSLVPLAWESAAVLSIGPRAALSHRSAAAVWSLADAERSLIHVTVMGRNPRPRSGVRVHRVACLSEQDVRSRSRIPVTGPARTMIDFASDAAPAELERALAEGRSGRLLTDPQLRQALYRAPTNHPGAARLAALIRHEAGSSFTRSEAERKLLLLIGAAELPMPEVNQRIAGFEVDFLWRAERLVVEVDGYAFHAGRRAFEGDRKRDQRLVAAGLIPVRVTWRQMTEEPFAVIARLARALPSAAA